MGAWPHLEEIAVAEEDSPVWYSILFYDSERLEERRRIRSFFIQEVDREGGDYEAVKPSQEEAERYVTGAADFVGAVERMLDAG